MFIGLAKGFEKEGAKKSKKQLFDFSFLGILKTVLIILLSKKI